MNSAEVETAAPSVPFFDLRPSHAALTAEIIEDLAELTASGALVNGSAVGWFEEAFARYCGRGICVGVASGLDGLRLGLLAAGIEPGDEVLVPAMTFVATFEAVSQAGAVPVPVDISEVDYGMDVEAAEASVTARTRFILPVHLYGQMADVLALGRLAARHDIALVEDACQAHGATRGGVRAGAAGLLGAFSFYPTKNLGALGDAGAIVLDDEQLAARVRALREHGQSMKYRHKFIGYTSRLDTIHAATLLRKLPLLDGWNKERRAVARLYSDALDGVGDLRRPSVAPESEPVWHLYVVRTRDPDRLSRHLAARGIGTSRHYPEPAHLTEAYRNLGYGRGTFPVSEQLADGCLSLPIFPGISEPQLEAVVEGVRAFFSRG